MRRLRLLFAALAAALVLCLSFAPPAHASGESEEACMVEAVEHNESAAAREDAIKACKQAPNPIVPEINEVIWGAFGFIVVFGFIWKVGLPAIKSGMNARTERIQADLTAAETQRAEADQILAEYKSQLADARSESARIIEEARQAADEVKATLVAKAEADIAEARSRATSDIEAAKDQAKADLRNEVAALAIGAAEQVVGASLDRAASEALVESYIDQVGAKR